MPVQHVGKLFGHPDLEPGFYFYLMPWPKYVMDFRYAAIGIVNFDIIAWYVIGSADEAPEIWMEKFGRELFIFIGIVLFIAGQEARADGPSLQ